MNAESVIPARSTLVTDFPIQGILDHLVERIVEILPITAAGVTLISAGKAPRFVAASNESALRFERLQTKIWQGPCLEAYETGEAVSIPDLGTDDRFPEFATEAVKAGLAAVFRFLSARAKAGSARSTSTAIPRECSTSTT